MVRPLLAGVLLASAASAAPVPKDFRKPAPKLDGAWRVTAYETNGREVKSAVIGQTWAFDGDTLTVTRATVGKGAAPSKLKFRADPKTRPMAFDYILAGGATRLGVFAVDGDTLTVCLTIGTPSDERPANLDGGARIARYVFRRVEKDR